MNFCFWAPDQVRGDSDPIYLRDGPDAATSEASGLGPEPAARAGRRELGRTAAGAGRPVPRGTVPKGVRGASPVPRGAEVGENGELKLNKRRSTDHEGIFFATAALTDASSRPDDDQNSS